MDHEIRGRIQDSARNGAGIISKFDIIDQSDNEVIPLEKKEKNYSKRRKIQESAARFFWRKKLGSNKNREENSEKRDQAQQDFSRKRSEEL